MEKMKMSVLTANDFDEFDDDDLSDDILEAGSDLDDEDDFDDELDDEDDIEASALLNDELEDELENLEDIDLTYHKEQKVFDTIEAKAKKRELFRFTEISIQEAEHYRRNV
jgi:hypothetical protein